ncbi:MAG: hypothetical protein ACHQ50_08925 [Fimbriimonadales bacterium]
MKQAHSLVLIVAIGCVSYGVAGCNSGDRDVSPPPLINQGTRPAGPSGMTPGAPGPTGAGPVSEGPMTGGQTPPNVKSIKEAQAGYDKAKKAATANPKDMKAKQSLIDATMALADANMFGKDADPKTRYKNALQYYREVTQLDPNNAQAKENADLIVSIYKQMGRPVPGGG